MEENIDENKINLSQNCVGPADDTPGSAAGTADAGRVRFRPICRADYPILADLINSTWGFDKMHDDPVVLRHFGLRYLYTCLIKHTFDLVAEIDGKAAGIIIEADYGADRTSLKYLALYYYHTACLTLRRAFSAFHDVNERYDRIMREMDDFCKEKGDTELALFILDERCRGLGIGDRLYHEFEKHCRENGIEDFYVHTDTACSYLFYEYQGMKLLHSRKTDICYAGSENVTMLLYGKKLQE